MKLLRWAVAGASVYAVYKYSIGKDAKGEDVIVKPENEIEKLTRKKEKPAPAIKPVANPKPDAAATETDGDAESVLISTPAKTAETH